ncbi:DUF1836 domain-containing protein [Lentilactobacillus sp. Marseille-Q4993]|uniref:DUF1836 domain-containing protein n=1 Tax=Lentilactobacillus sp. Marseille-Q4993 TaxID=3039492 RepID=UPI0024BD2A0F|nr:DUF1836 domain-containing protein [Lentilactobacillus sp. Marseille-Q4993]
METQPKPLKLPLWEELPDFSLHLDQLIEFTNKYVEPIVGDKLTKTMMHNYFKANVIKSPDGKLHDRIQVAGAIVVSLLKNVFSLTEIKLGLAWILSDDSPQVGYDNFVKMFNEQAEQKLNEVTSIDLKGASKPTVMQYNAVQTVLFWRTTKILLRTKFDEKM